MSLSNGILNFICSVSESDWFWKVNYYLRCLKKAPHGGEFKLSHPNIFLKYLPINAFPFLRPNSHLPAVVEEALSECRIEFEKARVQIEDLLQYCFTSDENDFSTYDKHYVAVCGNIITVNDSCPYDQYNALAYAADGAINYSDNFEVNLDRLFAFFICLLVEQKVHIINGIPEILSRENLLSGSNKYGLYELADVEFERQGFRIGDNYFLYNIFMDTSIGRPFAKSPYILELMKTEKRENHLYMRCDKNLSVHYSQKFSTATTDFQKWRGITLDIVNISEQIRNGKEVIVHYNESTLHKVLVYVTPKHDNNELVYQIHVEELWNPRSIADNETIVITNYVHALFYPANNTFKHIDFSVNQYSKDIYANKYEDSVSETNVPIDKYGDCHYKVWCIESDTISVNTWGSLVYATLDAPFRELFLETVGGKVLAAE